MGRSVLALLTTFVLADLATAQPPPAPMAPPVVDFNAPKFNPPPPAMIQPKDAVPLLPRKDGSPVDKSNVPPAAIELSPDPLERGVPVPPDATPTPPPSTANSTDSDCDSCGGCCNGAHCVRIVGQRKSTLVDTFGDWSLPNLFSKKFDTCNTCNSCERGVCGPGGRTWIEFDVLYWQVPGDPLPPLVTTSPIGTPVAQAGVLPNATIIGGKEQFNGDPRWGARLNAGLWLNRSQTFGFQAGGLMLENQAAFQSFTSGGDPILARPFFNVPGNTMASQLVAFPDVVSGTVGISDHNSFSGWDFAFRGNVCCGQTWRVDALLGMRHLRFAEQLAIQQRLVAGPGAPVAIGIPAGTIVTSFDRFDTGNYFYGLQAGLTGEMRLGERISLGGTFKASFGAVDQGVGIDGATRFTPPDTADRVGGLLALNSNIGAYKRSDASIVPELTLNLGYQWTPNVRFRFGYDFIYMANVQRPGNVIDFGIDPARIPPPLRPTVARPFFGDDGTATNMFVQGLHFGVEWRY